MFFIWHGFFNSRKSAIPGAIKYRYDCVTSHKNTSTNLYLDLCLHVITSLGTNRLFLLASCFELEMAYCRGIEVSLVTILQMKFAFLFLKNVYVLANSEDSDKIEVFTICLST